LFGMPRITFDELTVAPFRRFRWGVRSSGTHLPETLADALEDLWEARAAAATPGPASIAMPGIPFASRTGTRPHGQRPR